MDHHSPFLPLLLITLLAAVVPVLVSRLRPVRLPIVVGEILAGVVIGKSGLDIVESTPALTFLAEFGAPFKFQLTVPRKPLVVVGC
jgi:CPA2 family monovalent cation:H+ antiporter-2/trk system potassium uptake protein TrkA